MRIISASRRTDIPAFYTAWFLRRINAGYCHWIHPYGGQVIQVSLRPEDCLGMVFWTRYPGALLPHVRDLAVRGYRYYFQYTINDYPAPLEVQNPNTRRAIDAFRRLADTASPEQVFWRYDPIILSEGTPRSYHLRKFEQLAQALEGATRRCYFSIVDLYHKTQRNLREAGVAVWQPSPEERRTLVRDLRDLALPRGITLYSCCEDDLVGEGVEKAHCVDSEVFCRLWPEVKVQLPPKPTRAQCGCTESIDIGAYDTCVFGCAYCYATSNRPAALKRLREHDPADTVLWRPPEWRGKPLLVGPEDGSPELRVIP